jgi:hypothetical protein
MSFVVAWLALLLAQLVAAALAFPWVPQLRWGVAGEEAGAWRQLQAPVPGDPPRP